MIYLQITISFLILFVLVSCQGITDEKVDTTSQKTVAVEPEKPATPKIKEAPKEELIEYDKTDPEWKNKKLLDDLLKKLGTQGWKNRETAQDKLFDLILTSKPEILNYLIIRTLKQDDPEISFRSKKVLQQFFYKTIYDPDRKKGFIGLQLMEPGPMVINKEKYNPVRVVMPQNGFPGKAAGIRQGDLILGVDGKICGRNFKMNDFILYIASLKPGTEINLVIFSLGKVRPVKLKLAARPESARSIGPKKSKKDLFNTWYKRKLSEIKEKCLDFE